MKCFIIILTLTSLIGLYECWDWPSIRKTTNGTSTPGTSSTSYSASTELLPTTTQESASSSPESIETSESSKPGSEPTSTKTTASDQDSSQDVSDLNANDLGGQSTVLDYHTTSKPSIPSIYERDDDIEEVDSNGCKVDSFPELKTLFDSESHSDLTINIGKTSIRAHSLVLGLKSPVFAKQIADVYGELTVDVQDIHSFRKFIKFFYTERFPISANTPLEHVKQVYNLAKKYQVDRLVKLIDDNMNKSITLDNLGQVLLFAQRNNLSDTVRAWQEFVRSNSEAIFRKKRYLTEDPYVIECIMVTMELTEKQKILAIKEIKRDRRDVDITRFKNSVKFPDCDVEELMTLRELKVINETELWDNVIKKFDNYCKIKQDYEMFRRSSNEERHKCDRLRFEYEHLHDNCYHPNVRPINRYSHHEMHFNENRANPNNIRPQNGHHIPRPINV